jgi:hypothetical protein
MGMTTNTATQTYTCGVEERETGSSDWQPVGDTWTYYAAGDETPASIAARIAATSYVTDETHEGRVAIWTGKNADTTTEPIHVHHMPATPYGTLTDYNTGKAIRPATRDEWLASIRAGETGAFRDDDSRVVFVAGGPESEEDEHA